MTVSRSNRPLWVDALLDSELPPGERIVLIGFAWHQGGNGHAFPSERTLATELGISERNIRRAIRSLVAKGRLMVTRPARQGRGMANTYTVVPGKEGGQPCPPFEDQKADTTDPLLRQKGGQNRQKRRTKLVSLYKEEHSMNTSSARTVMYDWTTYSFTGIPEDLLHQWSEAYPLVSVEATIKRAAVWCRNNERKARAKSDWERFLGNWFSKDQRDAEAAGRTKREPQPGDPDYYPTEDQIDQTMGWGKYAEAKP